MKKFFQISLLLAAVLCLGIGLHGALTPQAKSKWASAPALMVPRGGACAVALDEGRILVTGGANENGVLESAEFLALSAPASMAAPMAMPRTGHLCVALNDGSVLVAGGRTTGGAATASAELYDPSTDSWQPLPWMSAARAAATATLLKDGRVLIAGGDDGAAPLASLEIFDPETRAFAPAPVALSSPRKQHAAALLPDGRVLLAGGFDGAQPLASLEIFDPSTSRISPAGNMSSPRDGLSATTLLDGSVFLAGGNNGERDLASTEIFNPQTSTLDSAASMDIPRRGHLALRVPDNNSIVITGGTSFGQAASSSGLYIPWRNSFDPIEPIPSPMLDSAGVATRGTVLLAGGATRAATSNQLLATELPTIRTDKSDYVPGETVFITGANWASGASVNLQVTFVATGALRWQTTVTADQTGNVSASFKIVESDLGKTFALTATEATSGRTAQIWTFSDGALQVSGSPSGVTFTFTSTPYGNSSCTGIALESATNQSYDGIHPVGIGGNYDYYLLTAGSSATSGGGAFQNWTSAAPMSSQTGTSVCVVKPAKNQNDYIANYAVQQNRAPTAAAGGPYFVAEGGSVTLNGSGSDPDGDTLSYAWDLDNDGNFEIAGLSATFSAAVLDGPISKTVVLRVTDSKGASATSTATVSVTNVAPTATFNAPASVTEGSSFTLSLTGALDPSSADLAALTYAFDCGDGSGYAASSSSGSRSCPTTDNSSRTVKGKVMDKDGGVTEYTATVTVTNVPPTVNTVTVSPSPSDEGQSVSASASFTDPGSTDGPFSCAVNYGDGSGDLPGVVSSNTCSGPLHSYADNGSFTVTIKVTDKDGGTGQSTGSQTVRNVAPTAVIVGAPADSPEGTAIALTSTVTDPGTADTHTYAWSVTKNGSSYGSAGTTPTFSFTPDDNGTYVVTLTVKDDDGGSGSDTKTVMVTNVAPSPSIKDAPLTSPEGTAIALNSAVTDPGTADTHTYAWSVTKNGSSYGSGGTAPAFSFTPDDNGTYVVTLTVKDDDGGSGSDTKTVTVTNVAPSPSIMNAPSTSPEGTLITLTSTVTDPGTADTHTYAWSVTKNGSSYGSGGTAAAFSFTPDDNGTYVVTLTVKDDDGDSGSDTKTLTVTNVAPSITSLAADPATLDEGKSTTLTVIFADPGADSHSAKIDWGDGSAPEAFSLSIGSRTFSVSHLYKDDNPTNTSQDKPAISLSLSDDDGGTVSGNFTVTVNNVAPSINVAGPASPLAKTETAKIDVSITDPGVLDTFTCAFKWDDGTSDATVTAGAGASSCSATHLFAGAGVYRVEVTVTDDDGGQATGVFEYVVVYDPSAGFVTGGGWINSPAGAYTKNPSLTGKATFGFVSKYRKGATTPEGNTEFQFHAAGMNFSSTAYQWLVVSGAKAQYKGTGTINGVSGYGFLLTATDGQVSGGGGVDKFRIKIWETSGTVVYDNVLGGSDDIDAANPQALSGGSIVIHSK